MPKPRPLNQFIIDLQGLPADMQKELRNGVRRAATPIAKDARSRASWSTRIPGAITLEGSRSLNAATVRLKVNSNKAPHARPWEFGSGRNRNLRYRLFGQDVWFEKPTRAFLFPAVRAGAKGMEAEIAKSIEMVSRRAGFR